VLDVDVASGNAAETGGVGEAVRQVLEATSRSVAGECQRRDVRDSTCPYARSSKRVSERAQVYGLVGRRNSCCTCPVPESSRARSRTLSRQGHSRTRSPGCPNGAACKRSATRCAPDQRGPAGDGEPATAPTLDGFQGAERHPRPSRGGDLVLAHPLRGRRLERALRTSSCWRGWAGEFRGSPVVETDRAHARMAGSTFAGG